MPNKQVVIFLQPLNNIMEVVRAAKDRDYYIVAVFSELISFFPPYDIGYSKIDKIIMVDDWSDINNIYQKIKQATGSLQIIGSYVGCEPACIMNAYLRRQENLIGDTVETIQLITDKYQVRQKLKQENLSSLSALPIASELKQLDALSNWDTWPAYFKPTHGAGSEGVIRCENHTDLSHAITQQQDSKNLPSTPKWLKKYITSSNYSYSYYLEEALEGELLSVEGYSFNSTFYPIGLLSRILFSENSAIEMGSCFPYPHQKAKEIIAFVQAAHKALNITYGPTHTEIIISPNGQIEIIDLNPRFVGADVIMSINNAYQIQIQELLLDLAIGKQPRFDYPVKDHQYACLQYILPPTGLRKFKSLDFPKDNSVVYTHLCKATNTSINSNSGQLDVLGAYLTLKSDYQQAVEHSFSLRDKIKINGNLKGKF